MDWLLDGEAAETPAFSVAKMMINPHQISDPHRHDNCHEFLIIEQGKVVLTIEGKTLTLSQGESHLIPPNCNHYVTCGAKASCLTLIYSTAHRHYQAV